MDSIPGQHIEDLPGASREAAYEKIRLVFLKRWKGGESEEKIAIDAGFGSADAMHQQLSAWGFTGLLPQHKGGTAQKTTTENKASGSGPLADLPPAANAMSIFRGAIDKLSVFVERLPSRREQRQGRRFVASYAKPRSEALEPGENYAYIEAPPDAQRDEHGVVSFTLDKSYRRIPGGASRYPDEGLAAPIAAALLTGTTTDELLDALHPAPTQKIREQARALFEGDTDPMKRRDSLKNRARQLAALIRGYPIGPGNRTTPVSKEWQSAAWAVQERVGYGYSEEEIARWLNEQDALLPEFKKSRKVTVKDVRDLKSLDFEPYPGFKSLLAKKE
jgi:hypothetical protein